MTVSGTRLDRCGCCGVGPEETAVTNTPGLSTLAYRGDTHNSVLERMLAGLTTRLPTLIARTTDDAGVALLDAWATVVDVVTFYQERIANEGYLRTATERRSVLELARAIGYELRPGVAAGTYLDFRVETAPGAPTSAVVAQGTRVRSVPPQGRLPQTFETSEEITADVARNEIPLRRRQPQVIGPGKTSLYLAGVNTGLRPGDAILVVGDERKGDRTSLRWDFRILRTVEPRPSGTPDELSTTFITWDGALGHDYQNAEVHAFRLRAALFGYNAPDWRTLPDDVRRRYITDQDELDDPQWPGFTLPAAGDPVIDLDVAYPAVGAGSWLVLRQPGKTELYTVKEADLSAREAFGISSKTTHIKLDSLDQLALFDIRAATVYTQTELLPPADEPIGGTVAGPELPLDRPAPLVKGQPVIVVGTTAAGVAVAEVAEVAGVVAPVAGTKTVTLERALAQPLTRDSVRILGNVVAATHGDTVADEVVGSGDATATHQRFTLRNKELTHLAAPTPSGVADTLEVRVDGVAWMEIPSLFTAGPYDRAYVVRIDDDAQATVIFGDGERGARLPTGQENVHARYRTGIGLAGNVDPDTLILLPQRPLGISAVSNPMRAAGGTAPESLADARTNAPLAVLTLDRVVSLRDYEDYARAFGGIAKARAVALWGGTASFVHVTIAGPEGTEVDSPTVGNLLGAFEAVRDRARAVRVKGYRPLAFRVGVAVLADPAYVTSAVHLAVRDALLAAYAIDRRSFGQPVTAAEVITVVQGVPGVVAARLTALYRETDAPQVAEVILAHDARIDPTGTEPDGVVPAELLLIDPDHIVLSEMAP